MSTLLTPAEALLLQTLLNYGGISSEACAMLRDKLRKSEFVCRHKPVGTGTSDRQLQQATWSGVVVGERPSNEVNSTDLRPKMKQIFDELASSGTTASRVLSLLSLTA
jgi:ribosomal protein S12 methylthiotransferase accessory factor YcaO